jgi:chitinase
MEMRFAERQATKTTGILLALFAIIVTCSLSSPAMGRSRVVAYFPGWSTNAYPCSRIDYSQVTDIAHAFVWPLTNGTLNVPPYYLNPELVETAHAHHVRMIVTVGGGSKSIYFPAMAQNPAARVKFVHELTAFCVSNKYDGVDYDWESPTNAAERVDFTMLVQETRAALDAAKPNMTVSAAVRRTARYGQWLDVDQLKKHLDWFGVMTYNFHTASSRYSGHVSPLYASPDDPGGPTYCVDAAVKYYLARGVPREKLFMGFLFHGYEYASTNMYAPSTSASNGMYSNVVQNLSNRWTRVWDNTCRVPYLVNSNRTRLITYDDPQSIQEKCDYAAKQHLRGAIIWALGQDSYPGSTNELLKIVGRNFLGRH